MTKHLLVISSIFLGCTLIPITTNAENTPSTTSGNTSNTTGGTTEGTTGKTGSTTGSTTGGTTGGTTGAPSNNSVTISKDSWLKSVTPLLPTLICKGFVNDPQLKKRLDDIKMTYEQCIASIPESVSKCQQDLYAKMPDKINSDSAAVWGKAIGECIGKDFAIKYLIPKANKAK